MQFVPTLCENCVVPPFHAAPGFDCQLPINPGESGGQHVDTGSVLLNVELPPTLGCVEL